VIGTSTGPAEIITDAGRCYLKALGNKEGPHALAADWIGTTSADWFGLRTFAVAKLVVSTEDEIELGHKRKALPGTAIASRAERGSPWNGSVEELMAATNAADVSRIVVLDTWLLNCDRHPADPAARKPNHDNVFLSAEGAPKGRFLLTAMDHTHCFSCGRDLGPRLSQIDNVKDARIYGRFPEFEEFLDRELVQTAAEELGTISRSFVEETVNDIADDWEVSSAGRAALIELIFGRADFVSGTIVQTMFP